jgi:hypothetical protein
MRQCFFGLLYFLNFAPLWGAIAVGYVFRHVRGESLNKESLWCLIGMGAGLLISGIAVLMQLHDAKGKKGDEIQLTILRERKAVTAELLMTYVLPLWAFDFTDVIGWAQFALLFIVMLWLSCRHRILEGSLFMELLKYWVYECTYKQTNAAGTTKNKILLVFSKNHLEPFQGLSRRAISLNNQTKLLLDSDTKVSDS